jgi:ketosteroid isomerase-like protein
MIEKTIARWHEVMKTGDSSILDELLADDVTFHSPVVHTPQEGKEITKLYLSSASQVFASGEFGYVREVLDGNTAILEFVTEIDGIQINGVDMIQCDEKGQIIDFKVMVRPLKAINLIHKKMGEMLQKLAAK